MATQSLRQALSSLVDEGVLTAAQADAVAARLRGAASPDRRPEQTALRQRLVEAAVYVGIAFVVTAVAIVIGQQWRELSQAQHIWLTSALTVVVLLAGLILARGRAGPAAGDGAGAGDGREGVRRRSASVLLTAAAWLAAATVFVVLGDGRATGPACFATALLMLLVAHRGAPSLLTEVALFVAAAGLAGTTASWLVPEPSPRSAPQEWRWYRHLVSFVLVATGVLWSWVAARWLRARWVAVSLGLGLALLAALGLSGGGGGHLTADLTLTALGVGALVTYLRTAAWPWIVGAVAATTLLVFSVAGGAFSSALAFLLAGLILLGGVGVVAAVRRRRTPTE